ncbi:MAG: HEAT repeat domain-containing protein [Promethearchaeota archaeon]
MIYTIALIIIFILAAIGGAFLISQQIKLVKAEIFSVWDYLKCVIYGFIFASGIIIIFSMMLIFAIEDPAIGLIQPEENFSWILYWPVLYLMVFLLLFPLADFLYIAHSEENKGLSAFQEFIAEKIIHRVKKPKSYIVAVVLWLGIFIVPPSIIVVVGGLPFIIIFLSWSMAIPIMIISFFGIRGYISGITSVYYHIPVISRSSFLSFDKSDRAFKEFLDDPGSRIMLGLMIFLYLWTWYSFFQTSSLLFIGAQQGLNNMRYAWSVFIVLIFGITGYFSRFWKRKVMFRWMDVLFAAWLIACVGINVMINFLISNSSKLVQYLTPDIVKPITTGKNFILFVPAAIIEEVIIVFLITYYILGIKNDFYRKTKYALVEFSSQNFDPIPLFNLLRVSQQDIREHAKEEVIKMYGRIPYKKEVELKDRKYLSPLFDAISDYNKDSHEVGTKIIGDYLKNHPKLIAPVIIEALESYNYDKKLTVAELVLKHLDSIKKFIPFNTVLSLLDDKNYQLRRIGIKILKELTVERKKIGKVKIKILLNDPDFEVQAETLKLISDTRIEINPEVIFRKIKHPNKKIKAAAALSLANLGDFKDKKSVKNMIESLIKMLKTSDWAIRGAVITALAKIGNFRKNKIPYEPFLEGIADVHKQVRDAAELALKNYLLDIRSREAKSIFNFLIDMIHNSEDNVKNSIFNVMEESWVINPKLIVPVLIQDLKAKNKEIRKSVSVALTNIGVEEPELVFEELLKIKEERTYLTKGIISHTVISICERNPDIIGNLSSYLESDNETVRINVASSLDGLAEYYLDKINITAAINALLGESSAGVKKELLKFLSTVSDSHPEAVTENIANILKILNDPDKTVRLTALNMLNGISKTSPKLIPINVIEKLIKDKNSFIRESAIKIIGNIGSQQIDKAFGLLKVLLNDKDWSIKNAAMETMNHLGITSGREEIIIKILELLDDKEKWTRMKALEITEKIAKEKPDLVPMKKIMKLIKDKDSDIRSMIGKIIGSLNADTDKFSEVFPLIIELMADTDLKVRESASSALVSISSAVSMKELLPKTLKFFSDETDILLQQSMALALKRIVKYEDKSVKQRVIDLLKIRSEMSQDKVLTKVLHELDE